MTQETFPPMQTGPYPDVPSDFGHWLAGFIDGEGCFTIDRIGKKNRTACYACRFSLRLRNDDSPIVDEIHRRTGLGQIVAKALQTNPTWESKPAVVWQVFSRADCLGLVALLDRHPLRAKKARDYALWREAVVVWGTARRTSTGANAPVWARMLELRERLQAVREYRDPHLADPEVVRSNTVRSNNQLAMLEPGVRR